MSILVNGMTMLTECRVCSFLEFYSHTGETWCKAGDGILASGFKPIPFEGRPDWCPLVELPEKHGRLIDADEIHFCLTDGIDQGIAKEAIMESPTVIEAEGEE